MCVRRWAFSSRSAPCGAELRRRINLDGRIRFQQSGGNLAEIIHRRTEDGRLRKSGGLERVVSAARLERAADEHHVGKAIDCCQFTDRIQQKYAVCALRRAAEHSRRIAIQRNLASADRAPARLRHLFAGRR